MSIYLALSQNTFKYREDLSPRSVLILYLMKLRLVKEICSIGCSPTLRQGQWKARCARKDVQGITDISLANGLVFSRRTKYRGSLAIYLLFLAIFPLLTERDVVLS